MIIKITEYRFFIINSPYFCGLCNFANSVADIKIMTKLKIGLFGIGHLGKIHLRCLLQSEYYELVGFYDPNDALAAQVITDFGLTRYANVEALLHEVVVVDIVTPTFAHFEIAAAALRLGKHVFIEKPVTQTVAEAEIGRAHV